MKKVIIGIFLGWVVLAAAGYLFLTMGGMPVRTKGPPLPFEKLIARTAQRAALRGESDKPSPIAADEANLLAGAKIYRNDCAFCHGLPGGKLSAIAEGLFPKPPQLFKHGVDDDPVGKTFWKVKNGIRLTGMPGFEGSYSDTDLWQVTLMLSKGKDLPKSVMDWLTKL